MCWALAPSAESPPYYKDMTCPQLKALAANDLPNIANDRVDGILPAVIELDAACDITKLYLGEPPVDKICSGKSKMGVHYIVNHLPSFVFLQKDRFQICRSIQP
jgi:hypothetical protein